MYALTLGRSTEPLHSCASLIFYNLHTSLVNELPMKDWILMPFLMACSFVAAAQDSTITVEAYGETYYGYDTERFGNHSRASYIVSHSRQQEFSLNLGLFKASLQQKQYRAALGFMTGSYANANLAQEPGVLQMLYEARAGLKLLKSGEWWLDLGVLPSHIGYESAVGKDCWTLSRSISADNTPYFETGAKLSYTSANKKWFLAALALNGWQRIQRQEGNHVIHSGTQITYFVNDKFFINSSSYIGSDTPDSSLRMRYFHNFYMSLPLAQRWQSMFSFDYGIQQVQKNSNAYTSWYSGTALLRYIASEKLALCGRSEFYSDKSGIMVKAPYQTWIQAHSLTVDWQMKQSLLGRLEPKVYHSVSSVFKQKNNWVPYTFSFTASLCFYVSKTFYRKEYEAKHSIEKNTIY